MNFWPFSKTYTVKCPGGHVLTLYRHVDDAFPLYAKDVENASAGRVQVDNLASANASSVTKSRVSVITFAIDDTNSSLMLEFRAAYIAYQSDPCRKSDFFERELVRIREGLARLRTAKLRLATIPLLLGPNGNEDGVSPLLLDILAQLNLELPAEAASREIQEARMLAADMIEDPQ